MSRGVQHPNGKGVRHGSVRQGIVYPYNQAMPSDGYSFTRHLHGVGRGGEPLSRGRRFGSHGTDIRRGTGVYGIQGIDDGRLNGQ